MSLGLARKCWHVKFEGFIFPCFFVQFRSRFPRTLADKNPSPSHFRCSTVTFFLGGRSQCLGLVGFQNGNKGQHKKVANEVVLLVNGRYSFPISFSADSKTWWMELMDAFLNLHQPRPVPATEEKELPVATKQGLARKETSCTSSAGSMEEQWGRSPSGQLPMWIGFDWSDWPKQPWSPVVTLVTQVLKSTWNHDERISKLCYK